MDTQSAKLRLSTYVSGKITQDRVLPITNQSGRQFFVSQASDTVAILDAKFSSGFVYSSMWGSVRELRGLGSITISNVRMGGSQLQVECLRNDLWAMMSFPLRGGFGFRDEEIEESRARLAEQAFVVAREHFFVAPSGDVAGLTQATDVFGITVKGTRFGNFNQHSGGWIVREQTLENKFRYVYGDLKARGAVTLDFEPTLMLVGRSSFAVEGAGGVSIYSLTGSLILRLENKALAFPLDSK